MSRVLVSALVVLLVCSAVAAPIASAQNTEANPPPTELWKEYPLGTPTDKGPNAPGPSGQRSGEKAAPPSAPGSSAQGDDGGISIVAIVGLGLLAVLAAAALVATMRRRRSKRAVTAGAAGAARPTAAARPAAEAAKGPAKAPSAPRPERTADASSAPSSKQPTEAAPAGAAERRAEAPSAPRPERPAEAPSAPSSEQPTEAAPPPPAPDRPDEAPPAPPPGRLEEAPSAPAPDRPDEAPPAPPPERLEEAPSAPAPDRADEPAPAPPPERSRRAGPARPPGRLREARPARPPEPPPEGPPAHRPGRGRQAPSARPPQRSREAPPARPAGWLREASSEPAAPSAPAAPLRVESTEQRALGYTTFSSSDRPRGPETRLVNRQLEAACAARGLVLQGLIGDLESHSGPDLKRPGLVHALDRLKNGEADCLMVTSLDRLSRSAASLGTLVAWLDQRDIRLVVVDIDLDTGTHEGQMAANALVTVGQLEQDKLEQRTRKGLEAARDGRRSSGRPAVADKPLLKRRIADMRAGGMTLQAIADELNREGIPTLRGGAEWRPSSVQAAAGYKRPNRNSNPQP